MADETVDSTGAPIRTVRIDQSVPGTTNKVEVGTISGTVTANQGTAGVAAWPVVGSSSFASVSFTRPANATPYSINDVVGPTDAAILTFSSIARVNGGNGYIVKARIVTNQAANVAAFRLHLYNVAPAIIADNAQMALLWLNRASRVGYIDFPSCSTEGTGSDCALAQADSVRLKFSCAAGSTALYGVLETKTVFTPENGQFFYLELETDLN